MDRKDIYHVKSRHQKADLVILMSGKKKTKNRTSNEDLPEVKRNTIRQEIIIIIKVYVLNISTSK